MNEILDIQSELSDDSSDEDLEQKLLIPKTGNTPPTPRRTVPTATVSVPEENNNIEDDQGQIEFVSDSDDNFVVVSDENNRNSDSDDEDADFNIKPRSTNEENAQLAEAVVNTPSTSAENLSGTSM